jgi:hypothetical protein
LGAILVFKIIAGTVAGLIIGILVLPVGQSEFALPIAIAFGIATFFYVRRSEPAMVQGPPVLAPSSRIDSTRPWKILFGFATVIAGIFAWRYFDDQAQREAMFKSAVAAETQEMLGNNFRVEYVTLPGGLGSHETTASVVFTVLADGERDSLTMVTAGNCADVCRIRMDPRDALRLGPMR